MTMVACSGTDSVILISWLPGATLVTVHFQVLFSSFLADFVDFQLPSDKVGFKLARIECCNHRTLVDILRNKNYPSNDLSQRSSFLSSLQSPQHLGITHSTHWTHLFISLFQKHFPKKLTRHKLNSNFKFNLSTAPQVSLIKVYSYPRS